MNIYAYANFLCVCIFILCEYIYIYIYLLQGVVNIYFEYANLCKTNAQAHMHAHTGYILGTREYAICRFYSYAFTNMLTTIYRWVNARKT